MAVKETVRHLRPGTYTYTVPAGVSTVEIHLWGAGGADGTGGVASSVVSGQQAIGTRIVGQTQTGSIEIGTQIITPAVPETIVPAGSQVFSQAGTYLAVLPAGVTTAKVTATGGSGSGAIATAANNNTK